MALGANQAGAFPETFFRAFAASAPVTRRSFLKTGALVTAMLLAAVGGVCAAMLPKTEQEEALIGERAERLKETAMQTAREQLERGKRVMSAAAEGAIEGARERATEVAQQEGLMKDEQASQDEEACRRVEEGRQQEQSRNR